MIFTIRIIIITIIFYITQGKEREEERFELVTLRPIELTLGIKI
jgi:hypothetical protein